MKRLALSALVAAASLNAACVNLQPKYVQPAAPVPVAFPWGAASDTSGATDVTAIGWRQIFPDRRLQQVIERALANNRDLRAAAANIESARALYRVQRAELSPTVSASGAVTYARSPTGVSSVTTPTTTDPGTGTGTGTTVTVPNGYTSHIYSVNLGLSSWEIDFFGRIRSLSDASLQQFFATEEARRFAQISLIGEVATDYLTLASDERTLQVARETLQAGQSYLDLSRARLEGGIASAIDLRQAQTIVEQARADIARYTTLVQQDRNALDLVVGDHVSDDLLALDPKAPMPQLGAVPVGLSSAVLLTRPDVVQAEDQLRAANANIGAARAAFFPRISLTATGGLTSTSLGGLFNASSRAWTLAPNIALPIFTGGANKANLQYAQAQRDLYVAQYERAIQSAFREVADALAVRSNIAEQVAAQQAQVDAASDLLRLSTARYNEGIEAYLTVLDAQRTLYTAQQNLLTAQLTQASNVVTLYRSLGGGLQADTPVAVRVLPVAPGA